MAKKASTETKLTDAQLVILSTASQRDDSLVVLTDAHPSVSRTIAALLRKELLTELVVQRRQPHWRQDENGNPIGLKLTKIGYTAIGAEGGESVSTEPVRAAPTSGTIKAGTKQAVIVDLLTRPDGASLGDLIDATGWLPHTTRAVLSGLRKRGLEVSSEKPDEGERRYSIVASGHAPAA